jgi:c-di-GMP-binding flagellar brake protein YcgR
MLPFYGREQRQYPRIPLWYIVKHSVCLPNKDLSNGVSSTSKNISLGGILIETAQQYPVSTLIEIELDVPVDTKKHVYSKVVGKVVRSVVLEKGKAFDTAVEFVSVPEENRENVLQLIKAFS